MLRDITDSDRGGRGRLGRAIVIAVAAAILIATVVAVQPRPVAPVRSPRPTPAALPRSAGLMAADMNGYFSLWLATGTSNAATQLWRSQDGGLMWTKVAIPVGHGSDIVSFQFLDRNRGYLVTTPSGDGVVQMLSITDDGGLHWRSYGLPLPENATLESIAFTPDGQGRLLFVGGDGASGRRSAYFYGSTDGRSWQLRASADANSSTGGGLTVDGAKGPIAFADAMNGVMGGGGQSVYVTTGGGWHWVRHPLAAPPGDYVFGPEPITLAAVGGAYLVGMAYRAASSPAAAFAYQSLDDGATWSEAIAVPTDDGTSAPIFTGSQVWWMASGANVSMTSDGGRHWLTNPLSLRGTTRVEAIYPIDDRRAWAFAGGSFGPPTLLYETTDGGTTWSVRKPPA